MRPLKKTIHENKIYIFNRVRQRERGRGRGRGRWGLGQTPAIVNEIAIRRKPVSYHNKTEFDNILENVHNSNKYL